MRLCKEMKVNLNQAILSHEDSSLRTEDIQVKDLDVNTRGRNSNSEGARIFLVEE